MNGFLHVENVQKKSRQKAADERWEVVGGGGRLLLLGEVLKNIVAVSSSSARSVLYCAFFVLRGGKGLIRPKVRFKKYDFIV